MYYTYFYIFWYYIVTIDVICRARRTYAPLFCSHRRMATKKDFFFIHPLGQRPTRCRPSSTSSRTIKNHEVFVVETSIRAVARFDTAVTQTTRLLKKL